MLRSARDGEFVCEDKCGEENANWARPGPRALIFNQQGRTEAVDFLEGLYNGSKSADGRSFDHVVFCTSVTYAEKGYKRGESPEKPLAVLC